MKTCPDCGSRVYSLGGVVGNPPAGRIPRCKHIHLLVCELPAGHEGYHRQDMVKWLGYHEALPAAEDDTARIRRVLNAGAQLAAEVWMTYYDSPRTRPMLVEWDMASAEMDQRLSPPTQEGTKP